MDGSEHEEKNTCTFLIAFTFALSVLVFYFLRMYALGTNFDRSGYGQLGDFFGGVLNPFFSLLSFGALLFTIAIQTEELNLTRKEMRLSRQAAEEQGKTLREQLDLAKAAGDRFDRQRLEEQVATRTAAFIDEFFSTQFICVRISAWRLRKRVLLREVSTAYIAGGFIYPSNDNYHRGESIGDLDEHEHLTLYFGFIARLESARRRGLIDETALASALAYPTRWHADLLRSVSSAVGRLASERGSELPSFATDVHHFLSCVRSSEEHDEIGDKHFSLLNTENC